MSTSWAVVNGWETMDHKIALRQDIFLFCTVLDLSDIHLCINLIMNVSGSINITAVSLNWNNANDTFSQGIIDAMESMRVI